MVKLNHYLIVLAIGIATASSTAAVAIGDRSAQDAALAKQPPIDYVPPSVHLRRSLDASAKKEYDGPGGDMERFYDWDSSVQHRAPPRPLHHRKSTHVERGMRNDEDANHGDRDDGPSRKSHCCGGQDAGALRRRGGITNEENVDDVVEDMPPEDSNGSEHEIVIPGKRDLEHAERDTVVQPDSGSNGAGSHCCSRRDLAPPSAVALRNADKRDVAVESSANQPVSPLSDSGHGNGTHCCGPEAATSLLRRNLVQLSARDVHSPSHDAILAPDEYDGPGSDNERHGHYKWGPPLQRRSLSPPTHDKTLKDQIKARVYADADRQMDAFFTTHGHCDGPDSRTCQQHLCRLGDPGCVAYSKDEERDLRAQTRQVMFKVVSTGKCEPGEGYCGRSGYCEVTWPPSDECRLLRADEHMELLSKLRPQPDGSFDFGDREASKSGSPYETRIEMPHRKSETDKAGGKDSAKDVLLEKRGSYLPDCRPGLGNGEQCPPHAASVTTLSETNALEWFGERQNDDGNDNEDKLLPPSSDGNDGNPAFPDSHRSKDPGPHVTRPLNKGLNFGGCFVNRRGVLICPDVAKDRLTKRSSDDDHDRLAPHPLHRFHFPSPPSSENINLPGCFINNFGELVCPRKPPTEAAQSRLAKRSSGVRVTGAVDFNALTYQPSRREVSDFMRLCRQLSTDPAALQEVAYASGVEDPREIERLEERFAELAHDRRAARNELQRAKTAQMLMESKAGEKGLQDEVAGGSMGKHAELD